MATLHATRGLPASGKTTAARAWVAEDPDRRFRVNRDDLGAMGHNGRLYVNGRVASPAREDAISTAQFAMVSALLDAGIDVVADDTNLNPAAMAWLRDLAVAEGEHSFEVWDMTGVPLEVCVARDKERAAQGGRAVGEAAIRGMHRRYLDPEG